MKHRHFYTSDDVLYAAMEQFDELSPDSDTYRSDVETIIFKALKDISTEVHMQVKDKMKDTHATLIERWKDHRRTCRNADPRIDKVIEQNQAFLDRQAIAPWER